MKSTFRIWSSGGAVFVAAVLVLSPLFFALHADAATVTATALTATSTNAYVNSGFATTSRVTTGDSVKYQLTTSGTPLIAPQINVLLMGSTTMSGSGTNWFYSTTSVALWTEGPITFRLGIGGTAGDATTTISQTAVTGTNVTYDATAPTLNSVSWSDVDGSTQFSAADTLTLTFSETMATSTVTSGNVDTTLGLSGSKTFGTSPTVAWNTAGTILTLTLGTSPTVATADTVNPSTAVKDSVGIADATGSALAITDNVAPSIPSGLADTTRSGSVRVALASTGSSDIHYTTDGSTPTCTTGTTYSEEFSILVTTTLKVIGCDEADNASSVATAVYTINAQSSSGGSSKRATRPIVTPAVAPQILPEAPQPLSPQFTSNLFMGSYGSQVKLLQQLLNRSGYKVAESGPGSPGKESEFFGALTKAALIKYQKAKGITPAAGYFGPLTRAAANMRN